ncbi:MAG: T9SS type A sorting domain-containing protein [Flavobacteriia bacterium]|nr:T9SS type A sorting domain-containing protein [Flavobacteriia bacterium]
MKKITLTAIIFTFCGGLFSQTMLANKKVYPSKNTNKIFLKENISYEKSGGDILYEQNFNGSIGDFTTSGVDQNVWQFDLDGASGQWASPYDMIQSTTSFNGFMIFDADLSNPGDPSTYVYRSGMLVSPIIDLSSNSSFFISFEHQLMYCCSYTFYPTLEVTTDGFNTFTAYDVRDIGFSVNETPGTVTKIVLIDDFINNNPNLNQFQFRFNFDGNSHQTTHYYWQIDDIKIIEKHNTEVSLEKLWLGDIFNGYEITESTPFLAPNLTVQGVVRSMGISNPNDFKIRLSVKDSLGNEVHNSVGGVLNNNFTNEYDTIIFNSNFALNTLSLGVYQISATLEYNGTDGNLSNNSKSRTFNMTQNKLSSINYDNEYYYEKNVGWYYGHDNIATDMIVGQMFKASKEFKLNGLDLYLADGTEMYPTKNDEQMLINVWEFIPTNPQESLFEYVGGDYAYMVSSEKYSENVSSYTFQFSESTSITEPMILDSGKIYLAAFNHMGGLGAYLWYWTSFFDDDYSSWVFGPFGMNGETSWFTSGKQDALIKMNVQEIVDSTAFLEENQEQFIIKLFPNPTLNTLTLFTNFNGMESLNYQIVDNQGKILQSKELKKNNKELNSYTIDVSDLSQGSYLIRIVTKEGTKMKKFFKMN